MHPITGITAHRITDSRGNPTLSVTVHTADGAGTYSVPSGASTGSHEAYELRDSTDGHGDVHTALERINTVITPKLIGMHVEDQRAIDDALIALDGTAQRTHLGGNALIGVSMASAAAAAASNTLELWQYLHRSFFANRAPAFPRLYANIINGGKHAHTSLAFQEYHIVPVATTIRESLERIKKIQDAVHECIISRYSSVAMGDEGGYALSSADVTEPLAMFDDVVHTLKERDFVEYALDVAATSFYDPTTHMYHVGDHAYSAGELTDVYTRLHERFRLLSIEDPFFEEDFASFTHLGVVAPSIVRIGDDLTVTSRTRLQQAYELGAVDGLIIKPNQVGTLSETVDTITYAHEHALRCIISHRSGETLDTSIADLAYACGAFGLKAGARGPTEREAKYTRLLTIEQSL